ncbi:MAG: methyltransferase domain-containing protein [archaeon]
MKNINSSVNFDRTSYNYCTNVSDGWDHGLAGIGFSEEESRKMILDVGCGFYGEQLGEAENLFGIDPNLGRIMGNGDGIVYRIIKPAFPNKSLRALAEELPFKDESFDFAYSTKAVGWYPKSINTEMALREMLRVIKKKTGVIVFNIGGEMPIDIINVVLSKLHSEKYGVNIRNNNWCSMWHPQHERISAKSSS